MDLIDEGSFCSSVYWKPCKFTVVWDVVSQESSLKFSFLDDLSSLLLLWRGLLMCRFIQPPNQRTFTGWSLCSSGQGQTPASNLPVFT